ncbi:MAG: hypothetical protein V3T70_08465 [Phycisphaerae bacterium]
MLNRYLAADGRDAPFGMYECPGDRGVASAPVDFEPYFLRKTYRGLSIFEITGTSYRLNNHIDFLRNTKFSKHFYGPYMRPRNRVPAAGETVLLEETVAEVAKWNTPAHGTMGWHRKMNRFNVAFVDGHAEAILLSGQTDLSVADEYWMLRGQNWRMDCFPDKPVPDRPQVFK